MMNKNSRISGVGSNVLIIPLKRDGDTWIGKVHSMGERCNSTVFFDDIVLYNNDNIINFKCPVKDPISGKTIDSHNETFHCVLYYQIIAKVIPSEVKKNKSLEKTQCFDGLDKI